MQRPRDPPAWGALPVEQFLIRRWNHDSPLTPTEQREQLIRQFLDLAEVPDEWNGITPPWGFPSGTVPRDISEPTAEEVDLILRPWRSQAMRCAAASLMIPPDLFSPVLIRTYDGNDAEEGAEAVVMELEFFPADGHWKDWYADDEELFALEGVKPFDKLVANILPKLPEIPASCRELLPRIQRFHDDQARMSAELRELIGNVSPNKSASEVVRTSVQLRQLQELAVFRTLGIIDQIAVETEKVLWLYLDRWGNIVRALRIFAPELKDLSGAWEGHANLVDNQFWEEDCDDVDGDYAGLGVKYRLRGEKGMELYGIDDLLDGTAET